MKNKKILFLCILGLIVACIYFLNWGASGVMSEDEFLVDQIKHNGEYQYADLNWGMSPEEVQDKLSYEIILDDTRGDTGIVSFYKSKEYFVIDGQSAIVTFEFYDGKLKIVKYDFHLNEDYEAWFEAEHMKVMSLCGEANEVLESELPTMTCKGYKWETDKTTLQIILLTGNSIRPSATIGVGTK